MVWPPSVKFPEPSPPRGAVGCDGAASVCATVSSVEEGNGSSGIDSWPRTVKVHAMKIPANNPPTDLEREECWTGIAARLLGSRKSVNQKNFLSTDRVERSAILPIGPEFKQLIFNFERIRNIDLRRGIIGGNHRLGTSGRPLLKVAGADCDWQLRAICRVHLSSHAT